MLNISSSRRAGRKDYLVGAGAASGVTLAVLLGHFASASPAEPGLPHEPLALERSMTGQVEGALVHMGKPSFVALDPDLRQVSDDAPVADSAYLLYGSEQSRAVKVFVGKGEGPVDAASACMAPATGLALTCEAKQQEDGVLIISSFALKQVPHLLGPVAVRADELDEIETNVLRFEKNYRYFDASGAMTSVTEIVGAPSSTDYRKEFGLDEAAMTRIAVDPGLSWQ